MSSFDGRETCLLHANCQGDPLARLLAASPEFSARWRLKLVTNYTRAPLPSAELAACTLFLYQNLGPEWGDLASEAVVARLPSGCVSLCVPNLFFKGYWPLWTSASSMHFGDVQLDYLTDQGLEPAEAVHVSLKTDVAALYDLDGLLAESQAVERRREAGAVMSVVDYVESRWRERQLFATVNHPGPELMTLVANAVLDRLDFPSLPPDRAEALAAAGDLACDPHFELPIHPGVARHFGLTFAGPDRRYPAYGKSLTWREYALCYVDCRRKGLDLLQYLQAVRF